MAAHGIVNALQLHLLDAYGQRKPRTSRRTLSASDRKLLADAIGSQLDVHHSLATLAALVDMDVRRFTAAFRAAFGLTPWQYVLRARLEQAARRLLTTDATVTGIALLVGFATPSHFATAFTQRFGVSPSRYRALAR